MRKNLSYNNKTLYFLCSTQFLFFCNCLEWKTTGFPFYFILFLLLKRKNNNNEKWPHFSCNTKEKCKVLTIFSSEWSESHRGEWKRAAVSSTQLSALVMNFQALFNCNKDFHKCIRFWFQVWNDFATKLIIQGQWSFRLGKWLTSCCECASRERGRENLCVTEEYQSWELQTL